MLTTVKCQLQANSLSKFTCVSASQVNERMIENSAIRINKDNARKLNSDPLLHLYVQFGYFNYFYLARVRAGTIKPAVDI